MARGGQGSGVTWGDRWGVRGIDLLKELLFVFRYFLFVFRNGFQF